jgi:hypothetical protein
LAPELKQALDGLDINFDGQQSVTEIQKAVLTHLRPELKLDDADISGAYKLAKAEAIPVAKNRNDSTFRIVRDAVNSGGNRSPREKRAARMDADQRRSRLTFAQQREFDRQNVGKE